MKIGQTAEITYQFTQQRVMAFAAISNDTNPLHINRSYAAQTPFKGTIVHGAYLEALVSAVLGTELPGLGAVYESKFTRFVRPVPVEDEVRVVVTVDAVETIERGERAQISFKVYRGDGKVAVVGGVTVQVWAEMLEYSTLYPTA